MKLEVERLLACSRAQKSEGERLKIELAASQQHVIQIESTFASERKNFEETLKVLQLDLSEMRDQQAATSLLAKQANRENELQLDLQNAKDRIAQLEEMINSNAQFEEAFKNSENEISSLKEEINELWSKLSAAASRNEECERNLIERENLLLIEINEARQKVQQLEAIIEFNSQEFAEAIKCASAEIEVEKSKVQELKSQNSILQTKIIDLESSGDAERANERIKQLGKNLETNRLEFDAYVSANDDHTSDYIYQIKELRERVVQLDQSIINREEKIAYLEQKIESNRCKFDEYGINDQNGKAGCIVHSNDLDKKRDVFNAKDSKDYETIITDLANAIERKKIEFDKYVFKTENECNEYIRQIEDLKMQVSDLGISSRELEQAKSEMETQKQLHNAEVSEFEARVQNLELEMAKNSTRFEEQIKNYENSNEHLSNKISDLQITINELESEKMKVLNTSGGAQEQSLITQLEEAQAIAYDWEVYASKQYEEAKSWYESELQVKLGESAATTQEELDSLKEKLKDQILEKETIESEFSSLLKRHEESVLLYANELQSKKTECSNIIKDRDSLKKKLDSGVLINEQLNTELTILKNEKQDFLSETNLLKNRLNEYDHERKNLTLNILNAKEDLEKKVEECHELESRYNIIQTKADHLQQELDNSREEFQKQLEIIKQFEFKLEAITKNETETENAYQIHELISAKVALEDEITSLKAEISDLKIQLNDANLIIQEWTDYSSEMENQRNQCNERYAGLTSEVQSLQKEIIESEEKLSELKNVEAELLSIKSQWKDDQIKLKNLIDKEQSHQDIIQNCKNEYNQIVSERDQLRSQADASKVELNALLSKSESSMKELKSEYDKKILEIESSLEKSQSKCNDLESTSNEWKCKAVNNEALILKLNVRLKEMEAAKEALEVLVNERTISKNSFDELKAKNELLVTELNEVSQKKASLGLELDEAIEIRNQKIVEIDELKKALIGVKCSIVSGNSTETSSSDKIATLQSDISQLAKIIKKKDAHLKYSLVSIQEQKEYISQIEEKLRQEEFNHTQSQKEIEALSRTVEKHLRHIDQLEHKLSNSQTANLKELSELSSKASQAEQYKSQNENMVNII